MNKKMLLVMFTCMFLIVPIVSVMPLVSAGKDVAYVVKNMEDGYLTNVLNSSGYTYDVIKETQISSTNFSDYRMVLVGEGTFLSSNVQKLKNITSQYNSLILNSKHYYKAGTDFQWGWSNSAGSISSPTPLRNLDNINTSIIVSGVNNPFNAYSVTDPGVSTNVLVGQKPVGMTFVSYKKDGTFADTVVSYVVPGTIMLNGKTMQSRALFFGITNTQYWTADTTKLFKNSLNWTLNGQDRDGDGYFDNDCNDFNASVHPGATEIPYNGVDENCDGIDAADLDSDGYCKAGYVIQNKALQCSKELGLLGTDCNDDSASINSDATDVPYNGVDENCDGHDLVDVDGDGYCNAGYVLKNGFLECRNESGLVGTDCNDNNITINKNATDVPYNGIDENCNGNDLVDVDGDGFNAVTAGGNDCNDDNSGIAPNATDVPYNGVDENCDGHDLVDVDGDGFNATVIGGNDCNDNNLSINFDAADIPYNGVDENCNGYDNIDFDNDGYCKSGSLIENSLIQCINETELTGTDCNDNDVSINPGSLIAEKNCGNDAPVLISPIPEQVFNEDSFKELDISSYFSDPEGNNITYSVFSISNSENINVENLSNGLFKITSKQYWDGNETVVFSASDGEKDTESNNVTIRVVHSNHAPILENISDQSFFVGQLVAITPVGNDPDGDNIIYSFSYPINSSGEWQTKAGDEGRYLINVAASDGQGGMDNKAFYLNIMPRAIINEFFAFGSSDWVELYNPQNRSEVVIDGCILENSAGTNISLSGVIGSGAFRAIDWADGLGDVSDTVRLVCNGEVLDSVIYGTGEANSAQSPLEGKSIGRVPDARETGNDAVDFVMLDRPTKGLSNSADMISPIVTLTSPANGQTSESRLINFEFNVEDNSNSLTCEFYSNFDGTFKSLKSAVVPLTGGHGTGSFWANDINDGNYIWNVKCSDGRNSVFASEDRSFSVNAPNAPVLATIGSKTIAENQTLTFSLVATDTDGGNLNYSAQNLPSGASFVGNVFSWTPLFNQSGSYPVTFFVKDSSGLSDSESVLIIITDVKLPIILNDAVVCSNLSNKITVKIEDPSKSDEFNIGDSIGLNVKVTNSLNSTVRGDLRAYLYDTTEDSSVIETKKKISLKKSTSDRFDLNITVPDDAEVDDNFVLYVVFDSDNCNSNSIDINLAREDDKLIIDKLFISPKEAQSGETLDMSVKVKNIGNDDQEGVYVQLSNADLGLNLKSDKFDIEGSGGDDITTKLLSFAISENMSIGDYDIKAEVVYGGERDSRVETISIKEADVVVVSDVVDNSNQEVITYTPDDYNSDVTTYTNDYTSSNDYTADNADNTYVNDDILNVYSEDTQANAVPQSSAMPSYLKNPATGSMLWLLNVLFIVGIVIIIAMIIIVSRRRSMRRMK